jgi:hypothetical protein
MVANSRNLTTLDDADPAVSWAAIAAGSTACAAVTLLLMAFGIGMGFSVVSPWSDSDVSSTTFTIAGGVYLIVVAMLSATIGGYLAGRLRSQWSSVHEHERYFRDSAHGLLVWAFAMVVSAAVLGGAFTHILSGASFGSGPAAGATAQGAPTDIYVDTLLRADPTGTPAEQAGQTTSPIPQNHQTATPLQGGQVAGAASAPLAAGSNQGGNRAEIARILAPNLRKGGSISDADRGYLVKVVSARTGLPPTDAEARVNQVIAQVKTTADAARSSAAKFSLWLVVSMLSGALSASLAAIEGGNLRNREWYRTDGIHPRVVAGE